MAARIVQRAMRPAHADRSHVPHGRHWWSVSSAFSRSIQSPLPADLYRCIHQQQRRLQRRRHLLLLRPDDHRGQLPRAAAARAEAAARDQVPVHTTGLQRPGNHHAEHDCHLARAPPLRLRAAAAPPPSCGSLSYGPRPACPARRRRGRRLRRRRAESAPPQPAPQRHPLTRCHPPARAGRLVWPAGRGRRGGAPRGAPRSVPLPPRGRSMARFRTSRTSATAAAHPPAMAAHAAQRQCANTLFCPAGAALVSPATVACRGPLPARCPRS